jgi:hypothetical protein
MITQKQRDAYRFALEDKGVPEVIAYMAACNTHSIRFDAEDSAWFFMSGGFVWDQTPEGHEFWSAIDDCACDL